MITTKEIIRKLKDVREEKKLSYNDIVRLIENNGDHVSRSTVQRVLSNKSDSAPESFKYNDTIRPIAKALLDIETIEADDDKDTQAMKSIIIYKHETIEALQQKISNLESKFEIALNKEKIKYHEKLEAEREQHARSIEFLKNQISLKDKRMDLLLEAVFEKDKQHKEIMNHILSCPYRGKCSEDQPNLT